jgi:rhodanese-related sulfurtransferase
VIDLNKDLLVICKAGGRSMMASQLLSQENIKCINISDGFEGNGENLGWKNEGLPSK